MDDKRGAAEWCHVHIQKTGGSSVRDALRTAMDGYVKRATWKDPKWTWSGCSYALHGHIWNELNTPDAADWWGRVFKFTCVRHPVDRLISAWAWGKGGPTMKEDWGGFVRALLAARTTGYGRKGVAWKDGYDMYRNQSESRPLGDMDFVMRFETLAEDFAELCGRIVTRKEPVLEWKNRSERRGEPDITDAQWRMLGELYGPDLESLGYELEVYRPEDIRGAPS